MEEKSLVPTTQQTFPIMDDHVIPRSRPVHSIMKSHSTDSMISSMKDDQHGIRINLKRIGSFGSKGGSAVSNFSAGSAKRAQDLVATDALAINGTLSSREIEHVVDFWASMPSSETPETSQRKNHAHGERFVSTSFL